eukprot:COSAG05_NODE_1933_length_3815_cov_3.990581_2_plen_736_part_00
MSNTKLEIPLITPSAGESGSAATADAVDLEQPQLLGVPAARRTGTYFRRTRMAPTNAICVGVALLCVGVALGLAGLAAAAVGANSGSVSTTSGEANSAPVLQATAASGLPPAPPPAPGVASTHHGDHYSSSGFVSTTSGETNSAPVLQATAASGLPPAPPPAPGVANIHDGDHYFGWIPDTPAPPPAPAAPPCPPMAALSNATADAPCKLQLRLATCRLNAAIDSLTDALNRLRRRIPALRHAVAFAEVRFARAERKYEKAIENVSAAEAVYEKAIDVAKDASAKYQAAIQKRIAAETKIVDGTQCKDQASRPVCKAPIDAATSAERLAANVQSDAQEAVKQAQDALKAARHAAEVARGEAAEARKALKAAEQTQQSALARLQRRVNEAATAEATAFDRYLAVLRRCSHRGGETDEALALMEEKHSIVQAQLQSLGEAILVDVPDGSSLVIESSTAADSLNITTANVWGKCPGLILRAEAAVQRAITAADAALTTLKDTMPALRAKVRAAEQALRVAEAAQAAAQDEYDRALAAYAYAHEEYTNAVDAWGVVTARCGATAGAESEPCRTDMLHADAEKDRAATVYADAGHEVDVAREKLRDAKAAVSEARTQLLATEKREQSQLQLLQDAINTKIAAQRQRSGHYRAVLRRCRQVSDEVADQAVEQLGETGNMTAASAKHLEAVLGLVTTYAQALLPTSPSPSPLRDCKPFANPPVLCPTGMFCRSRDRKCVPDY